MKPGPNAATVIEGRVAVTLGRLTHIPFPIRQCHERDNGVLVGLEVRDLISPLRPSSGLVERNFDRRYLWESKKAGAAGDPRGATNSQRRVSAPARRPTPRPSSDEHLTIADRPTVVLHQPATGPVRLVGEIAVCAAAAFGRRPNSTDTGAHATGRSRSIVLGGERADLWLQIERR